MRTAPQYNTPVTDPAFSSEPFVLPSTLPLIVLSDCYHFPGCHLPLRIFEERYRLMLQHALETDRLFAVGIRLESSALFPFLTAGLIRASVQAPDGTSQVVLQGLQRMRIVGIAQTSPFPIAQVEPLEPSAVSPESFREWKIQVYALLRSLASDHGAEEMLQIMKWVQQTQDPSALCDLLSFHLVKDPEALQGLLREENTLDRMALLLHSLRARL